MYVPVHLKPYTSGTNSPTVTSGQAFLLNFLRYPMISPLVVLPTQRPRSTRSATRWNSTSAMAARVAP
eukprot:818915-Heterocapsa_arctica.AAC.1